MNIFEKISRQATRFPSIRGVLMGEQLWALPLQSKSGFDLDSIAKNINHQLKETAEESFVDATTNPAKAKLELQLEVLKYIIAYKKQVLDDARNLAATQAERAKLIDILSEKKDEALKQLSPEDIQKRLDELNEKAKTKV